MKFFIITIFLTVFTFCSKLPPYPIQIAANQTAFGRYKIPRLNMDVFSQWIQDDGAKLLRLDIGKLEDGPHFHGIMFFDKDGLTTAQSNGKGGFKCTRLPITYDHQINGYTKDYIDYVGTIKFTDEARKGPEVHAYMGPAKDSVGVLNVIVYTDTTTGAYVGMDTVQKKGASMYWYDKIIMGVPDRKWFDKTPYCGEGNVSEENEPSRQLRSLLPLLR